MENVLGSRAVRLALRMSLAGFGLLLWHAPAAKAQECCGGEYTAAELAKSGNSAKKPVKVLATSDAQLKTTQFAKAVPTAASGAKASVKTKSQPPAAAKAVVLKQPVNSNEKKQ